MAATVFSLPIPLILLVHLHILEYPHANKPEYDHSIFDPHVRGLRERIKVLEDTCYFLVGRLEGNSRTILPSYPCSQPSDTIAFRTSLAKYLESLRHHSIYPTSKVPNVLNGKNKKKENATEGKDTAWWWKDVVVRKSLLEECSGEKFERLLLSVSTHALLHGVSASAYALPGSASTLLRTQPVVYSDLLSKYKSIRHTWSHSASVLLKREEDLRSIRERLNPHNGSAVTSKYSSLETERLVALANSKYQDLLRTSWCSREGHRALEFLAKLSGLESLEIALSPHPTKSESTSPPVQSKHITVPPPPLPIAAAHHPAHLKKIRRPVFQAIKPKPRSKVQVAVPEVAPPKTSRSFAKVALSDRMEAELRTRQALADALTRVRKVGQEMVSRVKALEMKRKDKVALAPDLLNLWHPDGHENQSVSFSTQPTPELLSSLGLYTPNTEQTLDVRIDYIRETLLPSYPPVPDLSAVRLSAVESKAESSHSGLSKIPRAKPDSTKPLSSACESTKSTVSPLQSSEPPRHQLITSTPPTVKLRATNTHQSVIGQTAEKHGLHRGSRLPRKSIRLSLATNRRPSLFATGSSSDEEDEQEDEVHRIVQGTHEESFEDLHAPATPKVKGTPIHCIFTGTKRSTVKRPKQSYPVVFHEPSVALPSLVSSSSSFDDLLTDATDDDCDNDDGWMSGQVDVSRQLHEARVIVKATDVDDGYLDEGPSMTLRDILLQADMTQFDLLDAEEHENLGDGSFDWA